MNEFKCVIVDDEPLARQLIREYLAHHDDMDVTGEAGDGFEALEVMKKSAVDLLFLDIQMPECDGFQLLSKLPNRPEIIFTTAFDQYAIKAFELCAVDYLLKPFTQERFDVAVNKAIKRLARRSPVEDNIENLIEKLERDHRLSPHFFVKNGVQWIPIDARSIAWIQAEQDYTRLFVQGKNHLVRSPFSSVLAKLETCNFVKIHRCHAINLDELVCVSPWPNGRLLCRMKNGQELKSSRSGARILKSMLLG